MNKFCVMGAVMFMSGAVYADVIINDNQKALYPQLKSVLESIHLKFKLGSINSFRINF